MDRVYFSVAEGARSAQDEIDLGLTYPHTTHIRTSTWLYTNIDPSCGCFTQRKKVWRPFVSRIAIRSGIYGG